MQLSVRGDVCSRAGRLIKLPHSAEEQHAHAKEDGGEFEDGVAAVRRI